MAGELPPEIAEKVYIAGGSAYPELTTAIAEVVGVEPGAMNLKVHPNSESYGRFRDNVRGRDVMLMQPHIRSAYGSVNDALVEQMLLAGAARSSGARSITAVCPYLGYTRQDRKDKGRDPIGIQMVIDSLVVNGVQQIVTLDMHSPASQGIHRGSFDNVTVQPGLREEIVRGLEERSYDPDAWLVVAPDEGALKMAKRHANKMGGAETVFIPKDRDPVNSGQLIRDNLGFDPDGRVCVLFDDMIDTAGTLVTAAEELRDGGAIAVHLAATHNVLSDPALERLQGTADIIERLVTSDTHPTDNAVEALEDRYAVVSCAPIVGHTIIANLTGGSVSALLDNENYF